MPHFPICALIAFLSASILVSAQQPQAPTFRSAARTVAVYATVTDPTGRLVPDLTRDDFEILDNGQPRPITQFDNSLQPITMIVMLDTSGSMVRNIGLIRSATTQLIARMVPGDKARVGSFGDHIWIYPEFTADVNPLIRFMWEDMETGGSTPLWNALTTAMNAFKTAGIPADSRRVVLVFTDGVDSSGNGGLRDVMQKADGEDFMIYAIGCSGNNGRGGFSGGRSARGGGGGRGAARSGDGPDPGLRTLADATGGGYFALTWQDDIGATFERVADELHHQYVIGFAPASDGLVHAVDIRVKEDGLKARGKKTYLADPVR